MLRPRQLACAQLADDCHSRARAQAVGAGHDHGFCIGGGADTARGLNAGPFAHYAAHQGDVGNRGAAKKAGRGLYEIGPSGQTQLATEDLFFQTEQRSLQNHFENRAAGMGDFGDGGNVVLHRLPVPRFQRPDVHDHVQLLRAHADRFAGFKALHRGVIGAQRKTNGRGHLHRGAPQQRGRHAYPPRIYANCGKSEGTCLFAQADDLLLAGFRFEEGVVDAAGDRVPSARLQLWACKGLRHPDRIVLLFAAFLKDTNVGQITKAFSMVQTVADHKLVGNLKPDVIGLYLRYTARWLIQQSGDLQALWVINQQLLYQVGERQAGVENIFHQNDILTAQRSGHVLDELHLAGGVLLGSVAAHGDEIERGVQLDLPGQIAQKQASALQHADQHHRLSSEVPGDLLAHTGHGSGNFLALEKDLHWG